MQTSVEAFAKGWCKDSLRLLQVREIGRGEKLLFTGVTVIFGYLTRNSN